MELNIVNKILFLIFYLAASNSFGESVKSVIALETYSHNEKLIDKDIAFIKDGSLIVNKEKLSANEAITQAEHLTKIANFSTDKNASFCIAGIYRHVLKNGNIYKIEKGCVDSEHYKMLKENFRALKKDHITE